MEEVSASPEGLGRNLPIVPKGRGPHLLGSNIQGVEEVSSDVDGVPGDSHHPTGTWRKGWNMVLWALLAATASQSK